MSDDQLIALLSDNSLPDERYKSTNVTGILKKLFLGVPGDAGQSNCTLKPTNTRALISTAMEDMPH